MLGAAFIYPITGIPQVIKVFSGNVDGVALLSWIGFLFFVSLFLIYSIAHKIKPMIITYAIWWIIDASVVIGIIIAQLHMLPPVFAKLVSIRPCALILF